MRIAVVDIGGTNIKSGLWEDGRIYERKETPTNAHKGGEYIQKTVIEILENYTDYQAIGISASGQVDAQNGSILYANENIPNYTGTRYKAVLEERFGVPVAVENDVNSAAIGEACFGAGVGHENFLCLTYGTGVGGGIFLDGQIFHGAGFSAGEFGGIITHPEDRDASRDSFSGCYEKYASTTGLVRLVRSKYPEIKNGREIFARMEEPQIKALIDQWIREIVYGLVTLIHTFNPSLIILGGGTLEQPYVIGKVRERVYEEIMGPFRKVEIVSAKLGNDAGLCGAAVLARKLLQKG